MTAFFANRRGQSEAEPPPAAILPASPPVGFDTVIGSNSQTEGTFTSSGNVRMDGKFTGSLEIAGNILVGESADIRADIHARSISIAGTIRGNVTGSKVQLLRTGRIWGDIQAASLTTEEGAFIDGKITMAGHAANRPSTDGDMAAEQTVDDLAASEEAERPPMDEIAAETAAGPLSAESNSLEAADMTQPDSAATVIKPGRD